MTEQSENQYLNRNIKNGVKQMAKKKTRKKVVVAQEPKKPGRPSKYEPALIEKVAQYIQQSLKKGNQEELPTMEGLAIYFGVVVNTLKNWAKENPEFLTALSKLHDYQKRELINRGLLGTYNPTITKLILSSNHGLREGMDITTGGEKMQSEPITLEQMKERIAAAEAVGLSGLDHRSINGGSNGE